MGVSVGLGSGVLVAAMLVSVGGSTGTWVSVGVAAQAENNKPRQSAKAIKTRIGLFFIPLIIPTFLGGTFERTRMKS